MRRWARRAAFVAAAAILALSVFAASAEARGGFGGGGFGGKKFGGKGGRRSGAQAQTLIDNAVRSDNVRRARHLMR